MLLYEGHGYFLLSVFLFVISENIIFPTLFDKIQISSPVLVSFADTANMTMRWPLNDIRKSTWW